MLRALVLVLILANVGFFAWREGWLGSSLSNPDAGREPYRMKAQVHPDRLVIVPPASAASSAQDETEDGEADKAATPAPVASVALTASASAPTGMGAANVASASDAPICMEAGPFSPPEQRQVAPQLAQLPGGSWNSQNVAVQGLWLVYMGPFGDQESYERKQVELRRIRGLNFEEVRSPANLAMGLSLGRYNQENQAQAALETLKLRGIRTARVVTVRAPQELTVVRVPQAGLAVQRVLAGLSLPAGKTFGACARH